MKKLLLYIHLIVIFIYSAEAQQIPNFQQVMTDGFSLNPAFTGLSGGSVSFTYRQAWTGLESSQSMSYLSGHTLLRGDRVGVGGNVYYEQFDVFKNYRAVTSGAYHMSLNESFRISFGLMAEWFQVRLDRENIFVQNMNDPLLNSESDNSWDVSSGFIVANQYGDIGVAYHHLNSIWGNKSSRLEGVLTTTLNGRVPVRYGYDLAEPRLIYQRFEDGRDVLSAAIFYSYEDQVVSGITYRSGSIAGVSLGFRVDHKYLIGYSMERVLSNEGKDLGASHEITFRYDLNKQYYRRVNPAEDTPLKSTTFRKKRLKN
ncbi:type IX secretion system membrane protein, PorP/SprF family [Ekhidna lutea]|uniref:Type IX secretion system membrane protein, PorP/SprF family n=1 Tax=Ekhidna lutea TaxID=447679 RepID=A0A239GZ96_EKHLU|nr:PorP/SprF family type IX secretion system membrane protein [Ekhidna lutea]SNS74460.1 type IX secretion system membrane protein, PorP/SprF family [Ekhidna lutea]